MTDSSNGRDPRSHKELEYWEFLAQPHLVRASHTERIHLTDRHSCTMGGGWAAKKSPPESDCILFITTFKRKSISLLVNPLVLFRSSESDQLHLRASGTERPIWDVLSLA